jgi:DNA invertase Pin-like site-specific DNA recombinase
MIYGYARVSSETQSYDGQLEALKAAGCQKIFAEKYTGKTAGDRKQLQALLGKVAEGDLIVVTKIDRFARSTLDLLTMLKDLEARDVGFKSLGDPMIDTTSAHGELLLTMLGAIATFERRLIRQRCSEGIARAKAEGRNLGRKSALNVHQRREALRMLGDGETQRSVARLLGVGQATIARLSQPMTFPEGD